jgi:tight adherence protein B
MAMFIVFLTVFAAAVLFMLAFTSRKAAETKQTRARLQAIAASRVLGAEEEPLLVQRDDELSTVPWLDRLLRKADFSPRLRLMLYQADLNWTVGKVLLISVVAACVPGYLFYFRTGALLAALAVGAVAGCAPVLYVSRRRSQRFERIRQLLPEAIDLMVAAIRAGHSFASAMGMSASESPEPLRREIRQCYEEQYFGADMRTALLNLARAVPIHDIHMIVTAALIQKDTGGNLTEILEKVAHLIREEFRLHRQIRVHTAQGRLTGWILALLPPALGMALYFINPEYISLLWKRPVGLKMLYGSTVMTLLGVYIIRRIVRMQI